MTDARATGPFTRQDLDHVTAHVVEAWRSGADRDWSVPAGTLTWSCARTADHTVDAVLAVAFLLASRRQDGYPDWAAPVSLGPDARPDQYAEGLVTVGRVLSGVIAGAEPTATAVIWRRPEVEVRAPADFAPRGALEVILHGHDVCAGLGVPFAPPGALCARLRDHTRGWPHWRTPGWSPPPTTDDPWADLLTRNGRPAAVLLSPDDLESLEETLDILSDPKALQEIRQAQADIDAGKGLSADDLRAKYLRK